MFYEANISLQPKFEFTPFRGAVNVLARATPGNGTAHLCGSSPLYAISPSNPVEMLEVAQVAWDLGIWGFGFDLD